MTKRGRDGGSTDQKDHVSYHVMRINVPSCRPQEINWTSDRCQARAGTQAASTSLAFVRKRHCRASTSQSHPHLSRCVVPLWSHPVGLLSRCQWPGHSPNSTTARLCHKWGVSTRCYEQRFGKQRGSDLMLTAAFSDEARIDRSPS